MVQVRKSSKLKPGPRHRSAEAKALALKHFRQRKLPNKKRDVAQSLQHPDDWDWYPDEGDHGC